MGGEGTLYEKPKQAGLRLTALQDSDSDGRATVIHDPARTPRGSWVGSALHSRPPARMPEAQHSCSPCTHMPVHADESNARVHVLMHVHVHELEEPSAPAFRHTLHTRSTARARVRLCTRIHIDEPRA